jgi:hypothetical protein
MKAAARMSHAVTKALLRVWYGMVDAVWITLGVLGHLWHMAWMIPLLAARGLVIAVIFVGWGWGAVREMYEGEDV